MAKLCNLMQNWLREIFEDLFSLPFIVLKWEITQRLIRSKLKSCNHKIYDLFQWRVIHLTCVDPFNHFSQIETGKVGGVVATGKAGGVVATGKAGGVVATGKAGGVVATGKAGGVVVCCV